MNDLMTLIKFPQITHEKFDQSSISLGDIPYAKHNIVTKAQGKQTGFLTEHTLFFIIQGQKVFHFDHHTVTVNCDELILLKRGIYSISEFIPENRCFEALMIFIPDKLLKRIAFESASHKTAGKGIPRPYVLVKTNKFLDDFRSQYMNYFGNGTEQKERLLQLKLQEVFMLLASTPARHEIAAFLSSCINKDKIDIEYIVRAHLLQPLTLADFAKLSMRSLASFKRDFKKQFQTSPRQWINRQRVTHAKTLLQATNKAVSEIAFECGFENVSHFIRVFKKEFGCTPNKARA